MKNLTLFSSKTRHNNALSCCCILFFLLFAGFFSQKISAQGTLVPACNLVGDLVACATTDPNDTSNDFFVNVTVARSGAPNLMNPNTNLNFVYTFPANSSGAFIRSYGLVNYNAVLNTTTQTLEIFPGTGTPSFNLLLVVTNTSSDPDTVNKCCK